jgi:hypothetical protein
LTAVGDPSTAYNPLKAETDCDFENLNSGLCREKEVPALIYDDRLDANPK